MRMHKWASFISLQDCRAIRFTPLWEHLAPRTPMGKRKKEEIRPYTKAQADAWQEEIGRVMHLLPLVEEQQQYALAVKGIEEIEPILNHWKHGIKPQRVEWFQLLQFLLKGYRLLSRPGWEVGWTFFPKGAQTKWQRVLTTLVPEGLSLDSWDTFHFERLFPELFEPLQNEMKEIEKRRQDHVLQRKKEVEAELGFEISRKSTFYVSKHEVDKIEKLKAHPAFLCEKETPFEVMFQWVKSELELCLEQRLSELDHHWAMAEEQANEALAERLQGYMDDFFAWADGFARLDLTYAKACFSHSYGGKRPIWDESGQVLELRGGFHPWLKEQWEKQGKGFTPVDITIHQGEVAVIVGPNMGGKSVAIKTLAVCTLLAHLGCLVPADYFRFTPVEGIGFIGGEYEELDLGLSSFGGEMKEWVRLWEWSKDRTCLLLFDEIGRGTNPEEGESLAVAIVEALGELNGFACFVSHFSGVAEMTNIRAYMIKGMPEEVDLTAIPPEQWVSLMDHSLQPVTQGSVPQMALKIAESLGMPQGILERAKQILQNKYKSSQGRRN